MKKILMLSVIVPAAVAFGGAAFADSICQLNCLATTQGEEQFLCLDACGMENAESGLEDPEVRDPSEKCMRDCRATKQGEEQIRCQEACMYKGVERVVYE